MNEDRVDRICYNINIQHDRTAAGNDLNSSAVFSESLARPLISNPSEWDVLINKFKIEKMGAGVFQDRGTRTAILVRGTQDSDFSLGDPGQEPGHFESFIPFTIFYFLKVKLGAAQCAILSFSIF